jgi:hypothetical protein
MGALSGSMWRSSSQATWRSHNDQASDQFSTTEFRTNSESLSDETLDFVVGGINPQPLPPRAFSDATVVTGRIER